MTPRRVTAALFVTFFLFAGGFSALLTVVPMNIGTTTFKLDGFGLGSHPGIMEVNVVRSRNVTGTVDELGRRSIPSMLHSLDGYFVENRGQVEKGVRYYSRGNPSVGFRDDGVLFVLNEGEPEPATNLPHEPLGPMVDGDGKESFAYLLHFKDANVVTPVGNDRLSFNSNFFVGNDPSKWRTDVPNYREVAYNDLYDGIDVVFTVEPSGLKYEFRVDPWTDEGKIVMEYEGVDSVFIDQTGVEVMTPMGNIRDSVPLSFQQGREISCAYVNRGRTAVGFSCTGRDRSSPLVIDPLVYSTYLGGHASIDSAYDLAVDSNGNAYVVGYTSSSDFPTTPGAFDTTFNVSECYVTKLNAMGSGLVYSTFFGSASCSAIAVDTAGNAYVVGYTWYDLPTTAGAYDTTNNGNGDAFVTEFNATGNGLSYSTYLGGTQADLGAEITIDVQGNAYVVGETKSLDFPTTAGAYDASYAGGTCSSGPCPDAFLAKVDHTGSTLIYSSFLGGSDEEHPYDIALDSSGDAIVVGSTESSNFPITPGASDPNLTGTDPDAFVTEFNDTGMALVFSTFLGGSSYDLAKGVAADLLGDVYVAGGTYSADFPVTLGAFQTSNSGYDAFVTKLNSNGTSKVYSTYLGGSGYVGDSGSAVAVDSAGNAYVTGSTASSDFPTTPDAFDTTYNEGLCGIGPDPCFDAFVTEINETGSSLVYSTILGGLYDDSGVSLLLDSSGEVYVAGATNSQDFPITPGSFQTIGGGGTRWTGEAFVTKLNLTSPPWPPSAPLNLQATAGNGTVSLTWTAPATDGGAPIMNYRIYAGIAPGGETYLAQIGNVTTYTLDSLVAGRKYYFEVSAMNRAGEGPMSNEVNATPLSGPPGPPKGLTATPGNGQITLSWFYPDSDGGSPITNYEIYRGTVSGGEAHLAQVGNVGGYYDTGLGMGETYYYQVSARNANGEGPRSNEANATTLNIPGPPIALVATAGNQQVTLDWSPPSSNGGIAITNYRIYRGTVPGGETFLVRIGNVLTYTNTGLTNGQSYYYWVTAENSIGEGAHSNEANATPSGGPNVPGPPIGLAATGGIGQITLTWSPPTSNGSSPITNYSVYRGTVSNGETFLIEIGNVLTYSDTGLGNGQRFYYKVSAKNAAGNGNQSGEASAKTLAVPGPPIGLSAMAGNGQITLAWSPPADNGGSPITNYRVHRGTVSGGETYLMEIGNVLSYIDTGLVNGQRYYYKVTAKNAVGEGSPSNETSAVPATTPGPPIGLSAVAGNGQVTLTWSPPTNNGGSQITDYRVYRGTVSGGESFIVQLGNVLSYVNSGLANGQKYYYEVSAVNAIGEGQPSNEANATPSAGLSSPSEPQNLQATPGDQKVNLTWTAPASDGGSPVTRYVVYRGLASGGETFLAEIGNFLTYTDAGLTNGQEYFYKVSAKNSVGEGTQSNEASAIPTTVVDTPSAPQNLQASAGDTQISLSWSPPSSDGGSPVTNYRIHRGDVSDGETLLVEVGNVLSYVDAGLANGQTYFYKVSAVNAMGEGPKSNEANATPLTPPPPQNLRPACNILSPVSGSTVAGTYRITGIAFDVDGTVQKVEIKIDDGQWIEATGNTSWAYDWDTIGVSNGQHTIHARSYDGADNSVEASVTVTVDNVPQPPPQETSAYQWAFWTVLAVVITEAFLLMYLLWKGRKGKEPVGEQPTEATQVREAGKEEVE